MTLIYADTSLLVSRYFFAFAHIFNHCHLERPRASLRCERESKDPEYASLLNADSRRSHENVSRELPVLASTRFSPWRSRPSSTLTFLSTWTALRWRTGTDPVGSGTNGRNISVLKVRNQPTGRSRAKKKTQSNTRLQERCSETLITKALRLGEVEGTRSEEHTS